MSSCRGRIIGFIGTVQGLSTAVGSLNMGDTADPEALKASLNSLTGGLGVAFDTTLLGLVLSMILSFPLAAVQKKEDEMLTLVDVFCTEKLLPKLNDTGTSRLHTEFRQYRKEALRLCRQFDARYPNAPL